MKRIVLKRYTEDLEIEGYKNIKAGCDSSYDVSFTRTSGLVTDNNYGADADGHRGESTTFVEEDTVEDISVEGIDLQYYNEEFQAAVKSTIEKFIEDKEVVED